MTISEKLQQVSAIKDQIRESVNQKGGQLSSSAPFSDYPAAIQNLSGGSTPEGLFEITVESDDIEKGTVSGGGAVSEGMMVTVKATPADAGYGLEGWYEVIDGEEVFQSAERNYRFEATRNRNLIAKFGDMYLAGRDWFPSDPKTYNRSLHYSIAYGDGIFFVPRASTTTYGYTLVSYDHGITWDTLSDTSSSSGIMSYSFVVFDGSQFVCATENGNISIWDMEVGKYFPVASIREDGVTFKYFESGLYIWVTIHGMFVTTDPSAWTPAVLNGVAFASSELLLDVVYTGNLYLAVTNYGQLLESEDGLTWSKREASGLPVTNVTYRYSNFIFGDGVLIILNTGKYKLYRSTDQGFTWTEISINVITMNAGSGSEVQGIYGNGVFMIPIYNSTTRLIVSTDMGETWFPISADFNYLSNLCYGDGAFASVGSGTSGWQYSRSRGPALP